MRQRMSPVYPLVCLALVLNFNSPVLAENWIETFDSGVGRLNQTRGNGDTVFFHDLSTRAIDATFNRTHHSTPSDDRRFSPLVGGMFDFATAVTNFSFVITPIAGSSGANTSAKVGLFSSLDPTRAFVLFEKDRRLIRPQYSGSTFDPVTGLPFSWGETYFVAATLDGPQRRFRIEVYRGTDATGEWVGEIDRQIVSDGLLMFDSFGLPNSGTASSPSWERALIHEVSFNNDCVVGEGMTKDCNGNNLPDECDISNGTSLDCNGNGIPDECDITNSTSNDFNINGIPDECEPDCQPNDIPDFLDIALGLSDDCNLNEIPDECESDCQPNGVPDDCDITNGTSGDCNGNDSPDECDIAQGASFDVNSNFVPDECDPGSCCANDGGCVVSLAAACPIVSWTLDGTCVPNICPQPGACCRVDTSCILTLEVECPSISWTEGEVCTLANCPAPDCNGNGIRDIDDITVGTSGDCNGNGVPDECDIGGAGTTTVFANGLGTPINIVSSSGSYPPGFLVTDLTHKAIISVSPNGAATSFATDLAWPVGAKMIPDEFGSLGDRLFVADATEGQVVVVNTDGSVESFSQLEGFVPELLYLPLSQGGAFAGQLLVTRTDGILKTPVGGLFAVAEDGSSRSVLGHVAAHLWGMALAPVTFGAVANYLLISHASNGNIYLLDEVGPSLELFVVVPMQARGLGLRQMAFSPTGWLASIDPELADQRVLLVSVVSDQRNPFLADAAGRIDAWNQRGQRVASLTIGPGLQTFEPRGLRFVGNEVLFSDIVQEHGWLISATATDFGLPDCDGDGILDECEIAAGSADCNDNAVPDECEVDCNANGFPDQCDLIDGTANDCNGNFIPDSCEPIDCNGNGQPDDCDIASGLSFDVNGNFVPDECDTGSCCDSGGTCAVTVETDCLLGAWTLDQVCSPNSCPQPGACCGSDGSCAITLEADCIDGAWTVGQGCVPNLCPQPGACCRVDTSCSFILEASCADGAWLEGEVCTLANCPSADCNANGIRDDQDIANATSSDCNGNGVPDECDIAGNGGATIFATGIGSPEEILTSNGDYPPGFFVTGLRPGAVYNVSSLGGTVTTFASGFNWPLAATIAPHEFGNEGERMFVADFDVGVLLVEPSGTVTPFTDPGVLEIANGLVHIPQSLGGVAGGKLLVTSHLDNMGFPLGSICVVDSDGIVTTLVESVGTGLWTPTLAPDDFGDYSNHVFVGEAFGPLLYAIDLTTMALEPFANVPVPIGKSPGLRQLAFSPIGWAGLFDPVLINERVLLVSIASDDNSALPGGAFISVWDQRGAYVATLSSGPDGLPFEPRGLLFVKNDLLVSDLTSDHDWLFRVVIEDFGLPDCDHDGLLDDCEIVTGSADCNDNAVPDECEIDCDGNGVADQCDLISEFATDCNGNFIPDTCEEPDCNDNGLPDSCDLADGSSRDLNRNNVPDECDTFVGDFDGDKDTDLDDYAILESCLAFSGPGIAPIFEACLAVFDFESDGDVDLRDVAVFQAEFTGSGG